LVSGEIREEKLFLKVKFNPIKIKDIENILLNCNNKSVSEVLDQLRHELSNRDYRDKIVTIRLFGTLSSGKTYEIKSNELIQTLKDNGAYEVFINKNALTTVEYQAISVSTGESNEEIEATLIKEHASKVKIKNFPTDKIIQKIHQLLTTLGSERQIGTKVMDYNDSLKQTFLSIFEINKTKERKQ
jgi:hypothetical protein